MPADDILENLRKALAIDSHISGWETAEVSNPEDDLIRVLKVASGPLKELVEDDTQYAYALQILADAARNEEWRAPLRESGLLREIIARWVVTGADAVSEQILRLIGNSCIDQDETRSLVAYTGFKKITKALSCKSLCGTATSALFNASLDYHPAQDIAAFLWIHHWILMLSSDYAWQNSNHQMATALDLAAMLSARAASLDANLLDESIIEPLATAWSRMNDPDQASAALDSLNVYLGQHCVAYIMENEFHLKDLLSTFELYATHPAILEASSVDPDTVGIDADEQAMAIRDSQQLFVNIIIEACDHPALANKPKFLSSLVDLFENWLSIPKAPALFECACIILGNLLLEDLQCLPFSRLWQGFVTKLLRAIVESPTRSLKHAAAGLLARLALSRENSDRLVKGSIGEPDLWSAIRTLVMEKDFTLMRDGLVLFRAAIHDSPEACQFVLEPETPPSNRLQEITDRCREMHGDSPFTSSILAECARGITAMTRVLLQPTTDIQPGLAKRFIETSGLLYPLVETLRYAEDQTVSLDCTVGLTKIALADDAGVSLLAASAEEGSLLAALTHVETKGSKEAKMNCAILIDRILRIDGGIGKATRERLIGLRDNMLPSNNRTIGQN